MTFASSLAPGSPYLQESLTKLKIILPVGKTLAWKLIATPKGITSWLLKKCLGDFTPKSDLIFTWPEGTTERVRVVYVGAKHSSLQLDRENQSRLRFYLHGRMTTLTFEVEYRRCKRWRQLQASELAPWTFSLANLKSIALGGPTLLNRTWDRTRTKGFVD